MEAGCEDLASVLTSASSQLCVLEIMFNKIGDKGLTKLCQALHSPHCKLDELQYVPYIMQNYCKMFNFCMNHFIHIKGWVHKFSNLA